MKIKSRPYEAHLAVREFSVPPGGEWTPEFPGWSLVMVAGGNGYFLRTEGRSELETGAAVLAASRPGTAIRASLLGEMSLRAFNVKPAHLTGLVTLGELDFFKLAATRIESAVRIFPPQHPTAAQMKHLCAEQKTSGLVFRLKLLQLFVEAFGGELEPVTARQKSPDARERLRAMLQKSPPIELVEMDFSELARRINCTPRHLSRIFPELVGRSFSEQRAETRMARARELLVTSNSKVVEVALESGYKSLSMFNLVFSRRFGTSPGRWRQKNYNIR
jgi:AraC-like DNA-binding protein